MGSRFVLDSADGIELVDLEEEQATEGAKYAVCRASLGECSAADCGCPGCKAKTLLEELDVLDVPDERQAQGWSCGAACVTAVARYFGVEPDTEAEAVLALGSSPRDGTDPEHIVQVLQDAGLETVALSGMDLETVEYFLGRGMPIIVAMQAWGTPAEELAMESGHYTVVIGIDPENVQVMDPARFDPAETGPEYGGVSLGGQKVAVPRQRFWAGWQDTDAEENIYSRYGISVRKRGRRT